MIPLFFGSSDQPLYGVYHPPVGTPQAEGVLLCSPFGQEYMRSHRAFRQLALLLSKKGFHVFRFDYFGTGDSSGDMDQATIKRWLSDVALAGEELRETAGIQRVNLVGLRLGALLATLATEQFDVERLALWDPVNSGTAYEAELFEKMQTANSATSNGVDRDGTLRFNGFGLTPDVREELSQIDLIDAKPRAKKVLHVVSGESTGSQNLRSAWGNLSGYDYQLAPSPGNWNYVDEFGGILLPQPVIQAIVNWMSE